ncbi:MAG: hypothetical protein ACK56Y_01750, partial [Pseudanabaena sp.]
MIFTPNHKLIASLHSLNHSNPSLRCFTAIVQRIPRMAYSNLSFAYPKDEWRREAPPLIFLV